MADQYPHQALHVVPGVPEGGLVESLGLFGDGGGDMEVGLLSGAVCFVGCFLVLQVRT